MNKWEKIRFGEIIKTNAHTYSPNFSWNYVNYLDTGSITENEINCIQFIDLTKEKLPSRARRITKNNSIVYSTVRPNQRHYGIIKNQPKNFLVSTGFIVIDVDEKKADADYIYFFLSQNTVVEELQALAEQSVSTYPSIKPSDIENLEIILPPIDTQKKIAGLLKSITSKIESNISINQNLLEQLQAILLMYMDSFPYTLTPLGEITEVIDCLHSKKPDQVYNTTKQLIQLDNITDTGFLDLTSKYYISDSDYSNWTRKCEIIEGDCVITNVGRIGAVSQAPIGTHAAMGRNMTCIRLKADYPYYAYLITVLLSPHMHKEIQKNTDMGTIMGALNVKNIPLLLLPLFNTNTMINLENIMYPIRKNIEENYLCNQVLSQIRDTLLPRLMSGELDVSNIDVKVDKS